MSVSVIIPAFNAELFIRGTLESVLAQSYDDLEIIVVDDGSTDETTRVVTQMRAARVLLVEGPRRGVSSARNEGVRRAGGEFIAFMDHDDLWEPDKIRRQVEVMRADTRVGLVFTQARVEQSGEISTIFPAQERIEPLLTKPYESLVHWNYIPMSAVMVSQAALAGLSGPFDSRFDLAEDWDLWLRILARLDATGIGFIPAPLTRYVILRGRATERMGDLRMEDIAILEEQLSMNPWLIRSDAARIRATRYRLRHEAGYWLLREGRVAEARKAFRAAWFLRPASLKPLGFLLSTYLGLSMAAPRSHPCA